MNPPTPAGQISEVVGRCMNYAVDQGDPEAVEQLIADVLRRTHQMTTAFDGPHERRAILSVAQSFADELATANPGFDRLRFIRDATGMS